MSRLDDGSVKPIEGIFVEGQVLDCEHRTIFIFDEEQTIKDEYGF